VTSLAIRVRESRVDLPSVPGGSADGLLVEVPAEPIKVDRGTVVFAWPTGSEARMILKVYGRMGVFNWLRKQVVGYRARREFRALARLRAAGIDCCEPLLWGIGRSAEHGLFEVLATREIPGAAPVTERAARLGSAERGEVLGRVFEQLARVHQAGFYHGAPYLSNVLLPIGPESGGIVLLDLEKSVYFARDIRGSKMARFDLLNLVNSTLGCMGTGYAPGALARYGLAPEEIARVFAAVRGFRSSKFQRYRRRAEFIARGALSRTWGRRQAAGAPLEASVGAPTLGADGTDVGR
jgi:hypothetical protein